MKKTIFPLLGLLVLFSSCEKDAYPLDLHTFDVRWYDDDHSGTQSAGDALVFNIEINATAPDSDDQYVKEWEFSYSVNDKFVGVLRSDNHNKSNSVQLDADVAIGNLALPFSGPLLPGDVIEFRIWARDNRGTEVEQLHRYVIEE